MNKRLTFEKESIVLNGDRSCIDGRTSKHVKSIFLFISNGDRNCVDDMLLKPL